MEIYQEFWIWTIESGWSWSGSSTTSADSWIDICGDGEGAAVKDDAAIVWELLSLESYHLLQSSHLTYLKQL